MRIVIIFGDFMMRTTVTFGILAAIAVFLVAQDFPNGEVAAIVNGETIAQKEVYKVLKSCYGKEQAEALGMPVVRAVLEEMIVLKVIEQKLQGVNIDCNAADYAQSMEFFEEPFWVYYKAWAVQNPHSFKKSVDKIMQDEKTEDTRWKTDMEAAWNMINGDEKLRKKLREEIYAKYYLDPGNFRDKIKIVTKFQKHIAGAVPDKEVEEFAQKEKFGLEGGRVKISHILLLTVDRLNYREFSKEDAEKIKDRSRKIAKKIKDDLSNFAQIAAEYSDDDVTRYQKGEIGWIPRWPPSIIYKSFLCHIGWISPWTSIQEVIDAAYHLPEQKLGKPIKSQLGYHLVIVTERKPGDPLADPDLKERAKKRMTVLKMEELLDKWMKESTIERKL